MTQGKKPFNDWQNSLGAQNSLLVNSASHILEQQLQNHLNANMNADMKLECNKNKVHDELTFATWIEKVVNIDMIHLQSVKEHTCLIEDAVKHSRSILTGPSACTNKQGPTSPAIHSTSQSPSILTKLLNTE